MAGWKPHDSLKESERIVAIFIKGKNELALDLDGKVIGSIGVSDCDDVPKLEGLSGTELGFALSKEYWGIGLMPEAVNRVIRYIFEYEKADFILCRYFSFNNQSKRVQEKCGFVPIEKEMVTLPIGKTYESITCILTNEDWSRRNTLASE